MMCELRLKSWAQHNISPKDTSYPTFQDHIAESGSVLGVLGDRFAKIVTFASPVINNKLQMVDGNGAANSLSKGLDHVDGSFRGSMLQDDPKLGESQMDVLEMMQEFFLGIHHTHILQWSEQSMSII